MALIKVLSDDTDKKIGEAASNIAKLAENLSILVENLNDLITKLKPKNG